LPHEFRVADLVRSHSLVFEGNPFEELRAAVRFEELGKGRRGAALVQPDELAGVPLVRTTTKYANPVQLFRPAHVRLAVTVQTAVALPHGFNNALIEIYTNEYTSMGTHSDQALDLADGSVIALFSCYEHPERADPPRKLLVESKEPGGERAAIPLTHNSVIVFSVAANGLLRHKIVLDAATRTVGNRWLGVTFRTSKTFVQFTDGQPHFADGTPLTLATNEQTREFYRLRRRENDETDFTYPPVTFTISESDLRPPDGVGCDAG
jgi:hypothetical protein